MRRSVRAVWGAVGLACAFLGGCGSSGSSKPDGGGSGGGAGGISGKGGAGGASGSSGGGSGTACSDSLTKYCDRLLACEPGYFPLGGLSGVADCVALLLPPCNDALAAPHTGETTALLQQCGDGYAAMSCSDFLLGVADPACYAQGGTIPIGGSCNNGWQCTTGVCSQLSIDTCGTCAMVTTVDQPCQVDASLGALCPNNLICTQTDPTGAHLACKPRVPIGSPCVESQICADNAYCDPTTSLCKQLPAIGQSCAGIYVPNCDPTQTGSICDGATPTCVAVAAAANGQACGEINGTETNCSGACGPINDAGVGICHTFLPRGATCTGVGDLCAFDTICAGGVCFAPVCGGAASSVSSAAVTAHAAPALDRRRALRLPAVPPGSALRFAR
jgi:hypothetical protein